MAPRMGRIGDWNATPSNSNSSNPSGQPRMGSLRDMTGPSMPSGGPAHGADDDDDDDDEDENGNPKEGESWFAGGERSGLSVQNPDSRRHAESIPGGDAVREVLRRAALSGPPPEPTRRPGAFTGGGHTLGSDEVGSSFVPDPNANPEEEETVIRHITFFADGFTIEDGPLLRYDDPANSQILAELNAGRAPPSVLNVLPGQPVELRIAKRINEKYVPPPAAAFSGQGHRLGAPVPGDPIASSSQATPAAASGSTSESQPGSLQTRFEVDQTLPTTSVQVRLADGTKIVCRMNLTHTVMDLRNFINASRPENLTRPYTIGTTFPTKTLDDNTLTIKDAGLANSVVVQRWV